MNHAWKMTAVLLTVILAACSAKDETETPKVAEPAAATAPASTAPKSAGGYEPSESERVPGITMSQEELDKVYAEARQNMPVPEVPQDAAEAH